MKEKHLQDLKASGISDEIISLNFRSLDGDRVYEYLAIGCTKRRNDGRLPDSWLKLYRHCEQGGWWASGVDLISFDDLEWGCFKPDSPRMDEYGLKPIKYEHPKGIPTNIFALKVGSDTCQKINSIYQKELSPDNFWAEVISDISIPIILTEGAKKAACLLSHGFVAIALPGIWGGYRRELKETSGLIPPLVQLQGHHIVFALDQDAKSETRKQVKTAINTTTKAFKANGCECTPLFWSDDFKGVDDLISAKGADYFQAIFANVQKKAEVLTSTPLANPQGYEEPKPWQGCEIAEFFTEEARKDLYSEGYWAAIGKDLYRFNGSYYEKVSRAAEERRYMDWANEHPTFEKGKWVKSHCQPDHINKIWVWVLSKYRVEEENVNPPGLNLKNGRLILEWKKGIPTPKLIPHSPHVVYTYTSEVSYNPKADPKYCDQLLQALEPDQQAILLRSLALAIDFPGFKATGKFERIRAVLCEGTGSNGKDAIRSAVSQIFVRGMTALSFNDCLAYDKGQKGEFLPLETACISWSSENSAVPKLDELQGLKAAITSDALTVKALYEDKKLITPRCVFFFNINGVPRMDGALEAIVSRWAILRFQKTFKLNPDPSKGQIKGDPRFKDSPQWVAENVCPALLNRLIEQIPLMLSEGIPYQLMDRYFREMREESCHLWGFVKEARIIENQDGKIGITELWHALLKWYEEMGTLEYVIEGTKTKQIWHDQHNKYDRNITSKTNIYKGFQRIFPKITRGRITVSGENSGRVFISGISFIPDSNPFASILDGTDVSASILSSMPLFSQKSKKTEKQSNDQNPLKPKSLQDNGLKQKAQKSDQTDFVPEENFWKIYTGQKLANGQWISHAHYGNCQVLQPLAGGWRVKLQESGAIAAIDQASITHVWEV